jgi:Domain of unknown function (DUF1848)
MRWHGWPRVRMVLPGEGNREAGGTGFSPEIRVDAIAPLVISASRSTDIPAFYGDWFMERLRAGYAKWVNPWNGAPLYVSLGNARLFVFWSKNPGPFLPHLADLKRRGHRFYTLFTLNDYTAEGLEPGVPPLEDRISTFRALSRMTGRARVVWRCDPLLLAPALDVAGLLERVRALGDAISPYTERMVISFIDIAKYPRVARNLENRGFGGVREFSPAEEEEFAAGLRELNRSWDLVITTCAEKRDLSRYGIGRGQCISYDLMVREFGDDPVLGQFLGRPGSPGPAADRSLLATPGHLRDPGQRSACGCVVAKDIGQYGTCPHLCVYCYANPSPGVVRRRYEAFREKAARGIFGESIA